MSMVWRLSPGQNESISQPIFSQHLICSQKMQPPKLTGSAASGLVCEHMHIHTRAHTQEVIREVNNNASSHTDVVGSCWKAQRMGRQEAYILVLGRHPHYCALDLSLYLSEPQFLHHGDWFRRAQACSQTALGLDPGSGPHQLWEPGLLTSLSESPLPCM